MVAGKSTGRATRGAAHQRQPSGRLANRVPGSGVGAWGAAGVVESLFDTWRRHAARAVGGNNPTTTVSFLEVQRPIRHVRGGNTVVTTKMELLELLSKAEGTDVDFLREGVRVLAQALMDVEVAAQIGAEYGQRAPDRRVAQRNGYRPREWDTRAGTVELAIPKLRQGSYFPSILEPRRGPSGPWPAWSPSATWRACPPAGSTTSPAPWAWTASPSRRSRGSVASSTGWSPRGATGRWTPARTRLCGWTP